MKLEKIIYRIRKFIRNSKNKLKTSEEVFTEIYDKKVWSGVSKSGPGSDLFQTEVIRSKIPKLLNKLSVHSILDIPCGDFNWMQKINLNSISYIGGDVVLDIIQKNNEHYSDQQKKFFVINILKDSLPKVDLIFCRDLLVHFSNSDIIRAIDKIKKSGSEYLLTTSFTDTVKNKNITTGDWRPINLTYEPFNFPQPLEIINENYKEKSGKFSDKSLCLWKISEI